MLLFARLGAFLSLIPVFSWERVPIRVRIAFALLFTLAVMSSVDYSSVVLLPFIGIILSLMSEFIIGALLGFAVRMIFYMAEFAGMLVAQEGSLVRSDIFDPVSQSQTSVVSALFFYLVGLLIFMSGIHYEIIRTFVMIYKTIPVGVGLYKLKGVESIVRSSSHIFVLGLKIAAPIIALNFVINMTFSVLGKAVPKMNVFAISFAVRVFASISLLLIIFGLILQYFYQYIEKIPSSLYTFFY